MKVTLHYCPTRDCVVKQINNSQLQSVDSQSLKIYLLQSTVTLLLDVLNESGQVVESHSVPCTDMTFLTNHIPYKASRTRKHWDDESIEVKCKPITLKLNHERRWIKGAIRIDNPLWPSFTRYDGDEPYAFSIGHQDRVPPEDRLEVKRNDQLELEYTQNFCLSDFVTRVVPLSVRFNLSSIFEAYAAPLCKKTETERRWFWPVKRMMYRTGARQSLVIEIFWTNQLFRQWKIHQRMKQDRKALDEWNHYLIKHKLEARPLGFDELCRQYSIKPTLSKQSIPEMVATALAAVPQ